MTHRLIVDDELVLFGFVGGDSFFFDGFTAREVVEALADLDGDITVRINSGGGLAFDGIAIYNALKAHDGDVTVKVDAIAASAASVIVMAGDTVTVPESAMLMIHNASGFTMGNKEAHVKTAEVLEKLDGQLAGIYAQRTGIDKAEISEMMTAETWMTGEEAVENGFADEASDDEQPEASLFDYRIYANAPDHLKEMFAQRVAETSAVTQQAEKEKPIMPDKPKGSTANPAAETSETPTLTVATLRSEHPELVDNVVDEAKKEERERITGIEDNAMPGHDELVDEMKRDGKTTPDQAAGRMIQAEKQMRANQKKGIEDVETATGTVASAPVTDTPETKKPAATTPEGWKAEYEESEKLQGEFPTVDAYVAFMKAEASGKVRILKQRSG